MKWKSRLASRVALGLARTWRVQVVGSDPWSALGGAPFLLLCWHEVLLPVMWHHRQRGIAAVISEARDGEYLARFALRLGYEAIRGSTTRGGARAYAGAIRALAGGQPVGMTPDGPRGPRRVAKPGAIQAAARSGTSIVPVHAEARPAWRAQSWDRFLVPGPFAAVRLAYGTPFKVQDLDPDLAIDRTTLALNRAAQDAAWPIDAAAPTI